jgi:hypothetical protein
MYVLYMLRFAFGVFVGVYAAQNYDIPKANTYIKIVQVYLKQIEKNLQEKEEE